MVPRLPPRSGEEHPPSRSRVRSGLETFREQRSVRTKATRSLSYPHRPPHGLLHMSPVNELPVKGSQFHQRGPRALNRRQALGLLATGIATGLAACSKPSEQIVPYVRLPEGVVPG